MTEQLALTPLAGTDPALSHISPHEADLASPDATTRVSSAPTALVDGRPLRSVSPPRRLSRHTRELGLRRVAELRALLALEPTPDPTSSSGAGQAA